MGCQFLLQLTYISLLCFDVITNHVWSMIGRGPEHGEVGKQWRQERGDHGYGQELSSGGEPVLCPYLNAQVYATEVPDQPFTAGNHCMG